MCRVLTYLAIGERRCAPNDFSTASSGSFFPAITHSAMFQFVHLEEFAMNATVKSLGIDRLGLEERLNLVEEIWDSIGAKDEEIPLTGAQRSELERRIAEDDANPSNAVSWDEVKAATLSRLGQ
jgi:putative addiction module component (TIGR02574 family)